MKLLLTLDHNSSAIGVTDDNKIVAGYEEERLMVVPEGLEDEADNFINNELFRVLDEITENGKTYYREKTFLNVFE